VGGDVFKFVQEFNKVSFPEAVEDVANRYNFTLNYEGGGGQRKNYSRVLDAMGSYYAMSLRDSDREYLKSRGLTAKTIKLWQIGWAVRSPEQVKKMESMLLPKDELLELGLLRIGERGEYAHFTERLMFPVHDHMGKCVGFSGRSLKKEIKAKYVNSVQSAVFDKSSILFGFDKAKEHVYKKKFIIIMEGQLDVILSHQIGIQTAVASQGTALTEANLPQLHKTGAKIVLAYDGDKAGRAAALKASILLSTRGFTGGVVLFPEGQDPASMIANGREEEVKRLVTSWTDLVRFVLGALVAGFNVKDAYGKDAALKECVKYLDALNNEMIAQEYVGHVARLLNIDKQYVKVGTLPVSRVSDTNAKVTAEELLLYTMYMFPAFIDVAVDVCDDEAWLDRPKYAALLQKTQDETMFSSILLKDGLEVLNKEQFFTAVRAKQKKYLLSMKREMQERGAEIEEIVGINERLKGLS